ncbi:MAG TPA: glycoside hydrolase family 15 protein [Kofleriaceae bacterium]|nr:glycoside hydrolase family 15 protein [Kofleriaceae bacterium]
MRRALPALAAAVAISMTARPAHAIDPVPSFRYLVTGNGHGFQVFDVSANAVKQYLERPYRYLKANPSNPDGEGIVRRNLAFDTYFGIKVGGAGTWFGGRAPTEIGYVEQSNMIRSALATSGVLAESFYVAPFGYEGNGLVMLLKVTNTSGSAQSVTAYSMHNFKMGSAPNPDVPDANSESIAWDATSQTATENGPGGGVMVYAPIGGADASTCAATAYNTVASGGTLTTQASCSGTDQKNAFGKDLGSIPPGEARWWGVAVLFDADGNASGAKTAWSTFLGGKTAEQLYTSVLAELEGWRKPPAPGLSATELAVWRQAETVLRMGQIREAYTDSPRRHNTGMILASLPPGGWHTGWVRDATYAVAALARGGHADEAKAALDFFLNADAGRYPSFVNNQPYRISTVRYYGDGQEEADYSGSPTRNIEIDGWGLVLWAARTFVDSSADTAWLNSMTKKGDTVYDALKSGIAEPIVANLESSGLAIADASIWEVHWGNRQHFLYTTATAARGLCDMATLARRAGRMDDVARYRQLAEKVTMAMKQNFVDSNRVLAGSLERLAQGNNYRDGATVEAFTWSLIDATDTIGTATLGAMSFLQTPAGGYKRVEGSNDQYDTDEWILIDLRASAAFRRAGNGPKADQLLDWVTGQATTNYDLLPELYNTRTSSGQIGAYSGSIPMVGYGAGAYQLTMFDRVQLYEHSDCGEKDLGEYPDAGPVLPGDGGTGPGGNGFGGRTGVACACQGGPGSAGNAVMFAIAGLLVLRRRRR